ncbi:MAG TPA: hypothetical protein VNA15_10400 [Candidatus Angelobacter sp.]|nr:hypothetical protein [Candidatus Angelobacter sp.]
MKKQAILVICVSLITLSSTVALPVRGATYSPGVKPGDYVTINHVSYVANGTLPPNYGVPTGIASLENHVATVIGDDVTVQQIWTFNNGSQPRSDIETGNVQTGVGNLTLDVISGGLSAGDPVFQTSTPTPFSGPINETVTRSYVGLVRTVNVLTYTFVNSGPYLFRVAAYLDAATGFLLEIYESGHLPNGPTSSVTFKFDAYAGITNAWSPSNSADYSLDSLPGTSTHFPPGGSVVFGVNLTSYNNFAGAVAIDAGLIASNASITNHPLVSPATSSLTLTASKSTTEILTVSSTTSTPFGLYIISVNATSGSTVHSARLTVRIVSPSPDFTIDANPISLNIPQGSSQNSTVTLTSLNGLSGAVSIFTSYDYTSLVAAPAYTSVVLASGGTATFQLKITATSTAPVGPYSVTVTGYYGATTFHSVTIHPSVTSGTTGDFSISATPASLIIPRGHAKYTNVTLASLNGFSGTVAIGYDTHIPGAVDSGLSSATLTPGGAQEFRVAIYVPIMTPPGNYYLNVSGTAQSTHTVKILVQVIASSLPGFNITITPVSQSITQGSVGTATVRLQSLNGFQGTVTVKSFFSSLPTNFNPTIITLTVGQALDSTLTISPSNSVTPGVYPVDVEGQTNSTGAYDSTYTMITVTQGTQPDFSLTPTSTAITVVANSIANDNLRVAALNGFTGTVSFIRVASPFGGVSYYCSPVSLDSTTTSATSTCTFSSSTPGTYTAVVNGTGGSPAVSHKVTYTVTVIKASPTISTTLSATTITAGGSVTDSATLTSTDPFTAGGTVTYQYFTGSTCTGTPTVVGSPVSVTYGMIPASQPQTFNAAGAFSWNAAYSGDAANNRATSICEPLTVNTPMDYTLTATPTTASITAGSTFTSTITATLTSGVGIPVTLSVSISPNLSVCLPVSGVSPCGNLDLSPITITPTSTGATSTLTVSTTMIVPPGTYALTITGLPSGTSSASATVTLTVTAAPTPDLTISANTTPISATTNSPATSTITVSAVHSFTGTVTLSVSAPSGITCTLDHTTLQGSGTAILTCTSNTPNDYTVTVTATGGAAPHTTTQTFQVAAAPSPAAPAPTILGLSPAIFYGIIGALVALVIGTIVVVVRRKNP